MEEEFEDRRIQTGVEKAAVVSNESSTGVNDDDEMNGEQPSSQKKENPLVISVKPDDTRSNDLESGCKSKETTSVPANIFDNDAASDSELPHHENPFAARAGKTLIWRNVNMTLVSE